MEFRKWLVWLGIEDRVSALSFLAAAAFITLLAAFLGSASSWHVYAWIPTKVVPTGRTHITRELVTTWRGDSPDVLLLGGSQVRELLPEDAYVSQSLSVACGRSIRVLNAASSSQLLETTWSIADHFRNRPPALVVIAPNIWRDLTAVDDASGIGRSLFLLPRAKTITPTVSVLHLSSLERWKVNAGILFVDIYSAVKTGVMGEHNHDDSFDAALHVYRGPGLSADVKSAESRLLEIKLQGLGEEVFENNVADYLRLGTVLRAGGSKVSYIFPPYAPEAEQFLRASAARASIALSEFRTVAHVYDLRSKAVLSSEDFFDSVHLLSSGRRKLWSDLERYLISNLPDCERMEARN